MKTTRVRVNWWGIFSCVGAYQLWGWWGVVVVFGLISANWGTNL